MRIGLRTFLVLTAVLGALLGFYGRLLLAPDQRFSRAELLTVHGSRYRYTTFLEDDELKYCVIRPISFDSATWSEGFATGGGGTSYVKVHADGLYVNQKPVPIASQVFVYTIDRVLRPIELTDKEYAQIKDGVNPISRVWLTKIEPVIDEEYHRGPYAHCAREEDCEYLKRTGDDNGKDDEPL